MYSQVFYEVPADLIDLSQSKVSWGDYDNDGDLDIILIGEADTGIVSRIYRDDGNDVFTEISASLIGVRTGSISWGDYDNDGDLDLLLIGYNGTSRDTRLYRNDGNDVFSEVVQANLTNVFRSSSAFGDYNNDGLLDILLTGDRLLYGRSYLYKNNGADIFKIVKSELTGIKNGSAIFGDYDSDGDLDIFLCGGGQVGLYRNDNIDKFTLIQTNMESLNFSSCE